MGSALAEIDKSSPSRNTTSAGAFILVCFALFQFIAYFKAFNLKDKNWFGLFLTDEGCKWNY